MRSLGWITLLLYAAQAWSQTPAVEKRGALDSVLTQISPDRLRQTVDKLVSFKTRHTLSDTVSEERGIGAARRWIYGEFEKLEASSQGRLSVWYDEGVSGPGRRVPIPVRVTNVIARLAGSSARDSAGERVLIVCAHYDSRATDANDYTTDAPGANDDGSGTAVVLELARVLSPLRLESTILFVAFAGEEQGLLGSTRLAEQARREGWNLQGVLNNDMVGNIEGADGSVDSTTVRLFAEALTPLDTGSVLRTRRALGLENDGRSRTLARSVVEIGGQYVPELTVRMIYRRDRFLRGGDQSPFHDRGFAAVRLVESKENTERQHRDVVGPRVLGGGDLAAFVTTSYTAKIATLNAAVLVTLACAPREPLGAQIVLGGPIYRTSLRWARNGEPDLAGYLVLSRETISPLWEHRIFTSDTTITLDEASDNMLFGIEAVDRQGWRSLPAIPSVGR